MVKNQSKTSRSLRILIYGALLFAGFAGYGKIALAADLSTLTGQNVTVDTYTYQDWFRGDNYVVLFNPQNAGGGGFVSRTTDTLTTGFPVGSGNYTSIGPSTPIGDVYYSASDLIWIYDTSGTRSQGALYSCTSAYTNCTFASTLGGDEYVSAAGLTGASREVYSYETGSCLLNCGPVFEPTRIISFTPMATSTATTSPIYVSVTYHTDTDLFNPLIDISVQLQNIEGNTAFGEGTSVWNLDFGDVDTSVGTHTVSTTSPPLPDGLYSLLVSSNSLLMQNPAEGGLTGTQLEGHFVVGSTQYPDNYYFATSTQTTITTGIAACDSLSFPGNLSCYVGIMVKNVGIILFSPDPTTLAAFGSLNTQVQTRLPFVYAYQAAGIVNSLLTATSTASTSIAVALWQMPGQATTSLTLISQSQIAAVPFSSLIYSIMTALIYLCMLEYVYYRVIRMHDTHTPS